MTLVIKPAEITSLAPMPASVAQLLKLAEEDVRIRQKFYRQLAGMDYGSQDS